MDKAFFKLARLAVLFLVLSFGTLPTTFGQSPPPPPPQCGYNNCTQYYRSCMGSDSCICVPFSADKPGSCIFRGLFKQPIDHCLSHSDCTRRGTGSYCMKGANSDLGWCLNTGASAATIQLPA